MTLARADQPHLSLNGHPPEDGKSEIAQVRREQILAAAESVIAGEGIHKLSLGRIEERAGMSRGQLTYYFATKESILIAVFDRLLDRLIDQIQASGGPRPMTGRAWDCFQFGLNRQLEVSRTGHSDLLSLLYTFLAQMGHRDDYRQRLSEFYQNWRTVIASDITDSVRKPLVPPDVAAGLVQALLHGIGMQLAVDPQAFDRDEMRAACLMLMAPLFGRAGDPIHTPAQPGQGRNEG